MKARLIEIAPQYSSSIAVKKIKEKHFTTTFHFHDYCELNYIQKGYGNRVVGDSIKNFVEGDLVLMSPNLPHMWYNNPVFINDPSSPLAEAIVVYFPIDFLDKLTNDELILSQKKSLFEKAKRGISFNGETKKEVVGHMEKMADNKGLICIIEFLKIFHVLFNSKDYELLSSPSYSPSYSEKDTERMNHVFKYIMINFAEPISLKTIASIAHLSLPAFCTFFKKRTQKSFTRFLNEVRVGHACKLLQNQKLSIADVCYSSGFQNLANFNKFFKQIIAITPSNYRKEYFASDKY